ncbi:MAG TPA: CopG family transcriptional regulator [Thermoanaerobaculia bacterium]|nr:CopG family transcriptional regulator [Thermoanaerobaculia bacterium]
MRTTLRLDDDVLAAARSLADGAGKSIGEVISELARRGLAPQSRHAEEFGFPVFAVSEDAPPLTPEMVRRALDDEG